MIEAAYSLYFAPKSYSMLLVDYEAWDIRHTHSLEQPIVKD
jgi:hypothetical protein